MDYEQFVKEKREALIGFLRFRVRKVSHEDIQDAVQHAFLKLWDHREHVQNPWWFCVTTAQNKLLNVQTLKQNRVETTIPESVWDVIGERLAMQVWGRAFDQPDVQDMLKVLTPVERKAFELYLEGLDLKESADRAGWSLTSSKNNRSRAFKRIRDKIGSTPA